MEDGYSATLIALLSIAFGWLLNSLGQWFGRRKGNHQIKNQVLYNLLEIHYNLMRLKIDDKLDFILDKLSDFGPEEDKKEMQEFLRPIFTNLISNENFYDVQDQLENIEETYEVSIAELAKIDPLRAHRLRGKTRILETLEYIGYQLEQLQDEMPEDSFPENFELSDLEDEIKSFMQPEFLKDALEDLRDEIVSLSATINPKIWWRTRNLLKDDKNIYDSADAKRIEKWLKDSIPALLQKYPQLK